ncbi:MAG: GNAT family N-acetyltransferase [Polyangiaceae bacterium]|nr:GNAT family N-acetyltransferase [Polyangiaceae bacterium]
MRTRPLGKADFNHIVQLIDRWWGGPTTALAHPIMFYELGSLARVVEHEGAMVGFLLGFIAPGPPKTGYVHLVGIHPDFRRRGVGKMLYETFEEDCREAACARLKSIGTTGNEGSIAFHKANGYSIHFVEDYAGPARPRVVFVKDL